MLKYLTKKADNSKYAQILYTSLRMDIIHGQICMSKYQEWKRDQKTVAHEDVDDVLKEDEDETMTINVPSPKGILKRRSKMDKKSKSQITR